MTLDPPSFFSWCCGALVMFGGVVAPLAYAFSKNKKAILKHTS
jgi:hypothetical protein